MLRIRAILLPADFSECSQRAFHLARALARDYQARLVVVYVATTPPFVQPAELQRALSGPSGYGAELQARLRQDYAVDARTNIEYHVCDGEPVSEVVRAAGDLGCDLIVMGTHGRTGLGRALMGSVAEEVLRRAPCPVMTVKWPLAECPPPAASG
jgi:nucleotide-binding universal stress UspA family protein